MSPIISAKGGLSSQGYGQFAPTGAPYVLVGNYDALSTVTVPSGGLSSITFASIPQTGYSHLQVRAIHQTNRATYNTSGLYFQFNGDTAANYSNHEIQSIPNSPGSTVVAGATANASNITGISTSSSVAANVFGVSVTDILDYANASKYKTSRTLSGADTNGAASGYAGYVSLSSGSWRSTSAITSITFTPIFGTLINEYSQFALYGVKA